VRSSRKSSTTEPAAFRLDYDPAPRAYARTLAMERICALFVGGRVPFDTPLSERAIAEAVGLGRMPVREALRELAGEGIVSVEAGRGTFLRRLDADAVTQLLEVRLAIEGMGARLAAEKGFVGDLPQIVEALRDLAARPLVGKRVAEAESIGDRVHWSIVEGAGNAMLHQLYAGVRLRIRISLRLVQRREVERIRETIGEHLAIAQAVLARSPEAAVKALNKHLRRGHAFTTANLEKPQTDAKMAASVAPLPAVARRRGRPPA
jgi:DNA-binding GntR family transcriptional regulator